MPDLHPTRETQMPVPPPLGRLAGAVRRWPVGSQQGSRRNAMVASTALAQRRAELDDVDEFLAEPRDAAVPVTARAVRG